MGTARHQVPPQGCDGEWGHRPHLEMVWCGCSICIWGQKRGSSVSTQRCHFLVNCFGWRHLLSQLFAVAHKGEDKGEDKAREQRETGVC